MNEQKPTIEDFMRRPHKKSPNIDFLKSLEVGEIRRIPSTYNIGSLQVLSAKWTRRSEVKFAMRQFDGVWWIARLS